MAMFDDDDGALADVGNLGEEDAEMGLDEEDIIPDDIAEAAEAADNAVSTTESTECACCGAKLGELNAAVPPDAVAVASGQPYPRLPFHKVAHMFMDVLCYVVAIALFRYMRLKDLSASVGVTEVACDHTHSVFLSSSRLL